MAPQQTVGPVEDAVGYVLKQAAVALRSAMDVALRPLRLTVSQYACLELLGQRPGLSNAELARGVFVTRQSMNVVLRGLEERGLVRRARDRAARTRAAHHTDPGRTRPVARREQDRAQRPATHERRNDARAAEGAARGSHRLRSQPGRQPLTTVETGAHAVPRLDASVPSAPTPRTPCAAADLTLARIYRVEAATLARPNDVPWSSWTPRSRWTATGSNRSVPQTWDAFADLAERHNGVWGGCWCT